MLDPNQNVSFADQKTTNQPTVDKRFMRAVEAISRLALRAYAEQSEELRTGKQTDSQNAARRGNLFLSRARSELIKEGFSPPTLTGKFYPDATALTDFLLPKGILFSAGLGVQASPGGLKQVLTVAIDQLGKPERIQAPDLKFPAPLGGSLAQLGPVDFQVSSRVIVPRYEFIDKKERGTAASTIELPGTARGIVIIKRPYSVIRPDDALRSDGSKNEIYSQAAEAIKDNELGNAYFIRFVQDRVGPQTTVSVGGKPASIVDRGSIAEAFSDYVSIRRALSSPNPGERIGAVVQNTASPNPQYALSRQIVLAAISELGARGTPFARLQKQTTIGAVIDIAKSNRAAGMFLGETLTRNYEKIFSQSIQAVK